MDIIDIDSMLDELEAAEDDKDAFHPVLKFTTLDVGGPSVVNSVKNSISTPSEAHARCKTFDSGLLIDISSSPSAALCDLNGESSIASGTVSQQVQGLVSDASAIVDSVSHHCLQFPACAAKCADNAFVTTTESSNLDDAKIRILLDRKSSIAGVKSSNYSHLPDVVSSLDIVNNPSVESSQTIEKSPLSSHFSLNLPDKSVGFDVLLPGIASTTIDSGSNVGCDLIDNIATDISLTGKITLSKSNASASFCIPEINSIRQTACGKFDCHDSILLKRHETKEPAKADIGAISIGEVVLRDSVTNNYHIDSDSDLSDTEMDRYLSDISGVNEPVESFSSKSGSDECRHETDHSLNEITHEKLISGPGNRADNISSGDVDGGKDYCKISEIPKILDADVPISRNLDRNDASLKGENSVSIIINRNLPSVFIGNIEKNLPTTHPIASPSLHQELMEAMAVKPNINDSSTVISNDYLDSQYEVSRKELAEQDQSDDKNVTLDAAETESQSINCVDEEVLRLDPELIGSVQNPVLVDGDDSNNLLDNSYCSKIEDTEVPAIANPEPFVANAESTGLDESNEFASLDQSSGAAGAVVNEEDTRNISISTSSRHGSLIASTHIIGDCTMRLTESELQLGKVAPVWIPDQDAPSCMICETKFTVIKRRHHCRACGRVLCADCSNEKCKLAYMEFKEAKVCSPCYQTMARIDEYEADLLMGQTERIASSSSDSSVTTTEAVAVRAGVLKKNSVTPAQELPTRDTQGGVAAGAGGGKHVVFSDGIKPGGDLRESESGGSASSDVGAGSTSLGEGPRGYSFVAGKPCKNSDVGRGGGKMVKRGAKGSHHQSMSVEKRNAREMASYLPSTTNDPFSIQNVEATADVSVPARVSFEKLIGLLKSDGHKQVEIYVKRNLIITFKIVTLSCCLNSEVWSFCSTGLHCVGSSELSVVLSNVPSGDLERARRMLLDILQHYESLYMCDPRETPLRDQGVWYFRQQGSDDSEQLFLGDPNIAGILYVKPTLQCLEHLVPSQEERSSGHLFGLLFLKWETPWAKIYPLRLLLRLGAEYKYYPCPVVNFLERRSLFYEIGHTILNLLTDFRNFTYYVEAVGGSTVRLESSRTIVELPKDQYNQVQKLLNRSNEHVLALRCSFSPDVDSHLVCVQSEDGSYQTQAISIENRTVTKTGAGFVIFNGSLKQETAEGRASIVEDGLMVQLKPNCMEKLREKLKEQEDYVVVGENGATVEILWTDDVSRNRTTFKSPIDDFPMDGKVAMRFNNRNSDASADNWLIRFHTAYILESNENDSFSEARDLSKQIHLVGTSAASALKPSVSAMWNFGFHKFAVRVTMGPDSVEYTAGAGGRPLPDDFMPALDTKLIPVLHSQSASQTHNVSYEIQFCIICL